jgi:hypothetical protein
LTKKEIDENYLVLIDLSLKMEAWLLKWPSEENKKFL